MAEDIGFMIERHRVELKEAIEELPCVSADMLGLDKRSGSKLYIDVDNQMLYCETHRLGSLDYYGGFEYVEEREGRTTLMGYVQFDGGWSERVGDCFDYYEENHNG